MAYFTMNLHLFGDGAGAGAAPAAGTGDGGEAAVMSPGTLDDGTVVDNRLAARMEAQAQKRRNRGERPVAAAPAAQPEQQAQPEAAEEPAEKSLEDEWTEAKKGKFKELIGRDIQNAIQDRFKNQRDANDQLAAMKPMLDALMKKSGAESVDELQRMILDDDSLYEDEAEEMGMPVEAYKNFKRLQEENDRLKAQEQQDREQFMLRQHFANLAQQAEQLKQTIPNFDLRTEMENETFRRLVGPNSGLKVEDAYYAVHHRELAPQVMAYGIQRATQQISQTLQANRARPVEGATRGGQPADVAMDPSKMTRAERQKLLERARRGEKIVF
ncbi:MAG: hypothetical protein J6Y48_03130 [Clostridia bacterium]|nr:hypothetical protein [Clostridia bacterium]